MLFEARQDRCPIKIVLEEINLPLIGQVVAPWIEVIDVDPWQSYIMQVLIEALLRCQFTTIWEVIVELVAPELLIDVLVAVGEFPLNVEQMAAVSRILDPA